MHNETRVEVETTPLSYPLSQTTPFCSMNSLCLLNKEAFGVCTKWGVQYSGHRGATPDS